MLKIEVQKRDSSIKLDEIRLQDKVPAVIYGPNFKNESIVIDHEALRGIVNQANSNSKVTVVLDGKEHICILKDSQLDFMKNRIKHVDFMVLDDKRRIKTFVPLNFVGQSLAVRKLAAVPKFFMKEIQVRCLPVDMPEAIDVDLAHLVDLDSIIHVSDLKVSESVEILTDALHSVATVKMPKKSVE